MAKRAIQNLFLGVMVMALLKVGDKAPDFTLKGADDKEYSLQSFAGKKVVIYFYPKDDTPGCTKEACGFRDDLQKITEKGAVIVGVNPDSIDSHKKFLQKFNLNFILLSDPSKKMIEQYGAKGVMGLTKRITYVVDETGKIKNVFPSVNAEKHSEEILKVL